MAIKTLDPRMINPDVTLRMTNTQFTNTTATNLRSTVLTGSNVSVTNLSATAAIVTNLTATNTRFTNLSVSTPVIANYDVTTVTSSKTFSNADNSKVFHFNTTSTSLCAIFPTSSLSNGFNVGIVNVGTGTVYLSSDLSPTINAPGTQNSTPYSGMFIYEIGNALYGVGTFD